MNRAEAQDPAANVRRIDDCLSVRDGSLHVDEVAAADLAARFGTPLYVISEDQLRRNVRRHSAAFASRWPGPFLLLPSFKANSCLALAEILSSEGAGCDTCGPGELLGVLRTGVAPGLISVNGPAKDEALLETAIRAGARITIDSIEELERCRRIGARVGSRPAVRLRVRPDVRLDGPSEMPPDGSSIRAAVQRYRPGIPTEQLQSLGRETLSGCELTGLMMHLGRRTADPALWTAGVQALLEIVVLMRGTLPGWSPRELDLGGGFPAPRDPFGRAAAARSGAPAAPPIEAYAEAVCSELRRGLAAQGLDPGTIQLEAEPGRGLYADAGVHLATVVNIKRQRTPTAQAWVETDTSEAYLADVNLEQNRWTVLAAQDADAPTAIRADVTGRTCGLDVIVPDADLPALRRGDVLAFLDTGAYQDAGASNFNALPRPGTVLVTGSGAAVIRRHETVDDVFRRDQIPARLRSAPAHPRGPVVAGIDHVAITAADLDRSLSFYCGLLGLELLGRGEASGAPEFAITGIPDAVVRWADVALPDGRTVELLQYVSPRGSAVRPAVNDPGATHLAFQVPGLDAAVDRLARGGVGTRTAPVEIQAPGAWQGARCVYVSDPDGVTVELIERPAPRAEGAGAAGAGAPLDR